MLWVHHKEPPVNLVSVPLHKEEGGGDPTPVLGKSARKPKGARKKNPVVTEKE